LSSDIPDSRQERPAHRSPLSSYFAANLRFFLLVIAGLMVLFSLLRLGLVLRNIEPGAATRSELIWAFIIGLRFDFAIACYIAIPMLILCYIPWTAPWFSRRSRSVYLWVWSVILLILTFILLSEFEFFREFQSRLNQLAFRYFDHPETVLGMIWYNYPVLKYVAGTLGVGLVIYIALRLALRWAYPPQEPGHRVNYVGEILGAVVIVVVAVFGARGGFQGEPLQWGDAFKGNSEFANEMSLNGLYSLGEAVKDTFSRDQISSKWRGKMPMDDARLVVRAMLVARGEKLLDVKNRTVLREGDVGSNLVLKSTNGKPINVVIVKMESFSARFVGACGAEHSFTPYFDALAKDGVLFDRCLSAGTHTHQAIFATELGFPNLPGYEALMESGVANQDFLSAPEIFQKRGYQTFFLYNGDFSWDNMRGFFRKQGVQKFVGRDEMKADAKFVDEVWGVSDGDLFDRANREFEAAAKKGPFMAAMLTLSNHAPFQVPPVPGVGPITDQGEYNGRLEAMRYADWAVGKFISDAKKLDYFKNTLFVFVGDHGFHVPPVLTEVHLLYHHVPLLFYAPGLNLQPRVDHRVATHMNIIPSVLGLLGITDSPQAAWARSLFYDSFPDENFAVFKNTGGGRAVAIAQGNKLLVLGSATGHPLLMTYDLGPKPTVKPLDDPALEKKLERHLRAYVQAALDDLLMRRAGPMPEK
jgi:phosphoglycerol transferase MdoB-like AlkP superfamily enzyme